jgi:hypothetical protein
LFGGSLGLRIGVNTGRCRRGRGPRGQLLRDR